MNVGFSCGPDSVDAASAVADPISGTAQTKYTDGTTLGFDITSVSNTAFAVCLPTAYEYVTDDSGTDTPATNMVDYASPIPVSGTQFLAIPVS